MTALKNDDIYLVGVYGMGGVGKTTLIKQVWRQVMEEKLFDVVVMTTITEGIDLKNIQVDIANQLGLTRLQDLDNKWGRAAMLSKRLEKEKRILVILDDLWNPELDILGDVGIPCGKNYTNVCKVAITTRDVVICRLFGANNSSPRQENIEVGVLSNEDSKFLFMKNVGQEVDSPAAELIVEGCNGLPLALVTLGRAMINKGVPVWNDTASDMSRSNYTMLRGTFSKVFVSIELSYKHLENDIGDVLDETIVACLQTLDEVRGRIQTVLDKLITSCLTLSYTKKKNNGIVSSVTMHGIVRDVALHIAREKSNGFFVSEHAPNREADWDMIKNCSRVSLMKNNICMLPELPLPFPLLLVLSLQQNPLLKWIPDGFFRTMDALVSLDISKTDLPNEIGELSNLMALDLSHNYELIVPPNVISRLYRLEELYMMNSFKKWEVEDRNSGRYATLDEVASRTSLKTLHLMKENEKRALMLCISIGWQASGKYYVQNYDGIADQFECSLKDASPPFDQSIKMLLARVGNLMLSECSGLLIVGELASDDGFTKMRTLLVLKCLDMQFLMDFSVNKIPESTFSALEKLYLHSLSNLKQITHGPMPAEFFGKLKVMELLECEEMVCLFSPDRLLKFENLEIVPMENCGKLTEGIFLGKGGSENLDVAFPELRERYLKTLPKLMTICKGVGSTENLRKLKIMEVKSCNLLAYLFTSTMVSALQQLERLEIGDCRSMVSIVALEEDTRQTDNGERYVFPQLEHLFIYSLPSLKAICNRSTIPKGSFKKLRKFDILNCGNLEQLCFPGNVVLYGGLSNLEYISVVRCNSLVAIIYDDNEHASKKPPQQQILPRLTELILRALPNLEMIVKGVKMSSKSFENLKKVNVKDCKIMKHLLPMSLLGPGGLPNLERVYLGDCNKMESIFYDDNHGGKKVKSAAEKKLAGQQLDRLSKLINVHPVQSSSQWPYLEAIIVKNCGNLKNLEWEVSQRLL